MNIFGILSMIGGLALFLYGMDAMGAGLSKLSGGRMERLLEKLTSKRIMAVLLGAGVTAVIQSSSATTVMVVGFVNSGIMKLNQAVGIIMGANIGTTITSWLLSLTGIQGSSFVLQMLKPSSFSPILAVIGVGLIMFTKNEKKKDIGSIFIGFAILMYGMEAMSGAVAPLADNEKFTGILTMFSNPLLGLLAGTILTAVIQSSSASVGVLQTLAATSGAVTTSAAVFICLGADIGSCMPAVLSSIGAQRNAKRVAAIHLIFNVIGAIVLGTAGFILFRIMPGFAHTAIDSVGISVFHTGAKIVDVIIQFPFAMGLVKLSGLLVKETEADRLAEENDEKATLRHLDRRILKSPDFAVENAIKEVVHMGEITNENLKDACQAVMSYDKD